MIRVPPNDQHAEQSVLGGLMIAPHAWHNVADLLTAGDFYRQTHQLIWRAIKELADAGKPFDCVMVGGWFESQGLSAEVQGGAYLIDLSSNTPSAANIRAYADIVKDRSLLRGLIEAGTRAVNAGFEPEGRDALAIIAETQSGVGALLQSQPCELEEMAPILTAFYQTLQRRHELNGALDGLSSGLTEFDAMTNGLRPGQLVVVAARPAMGKTTLAMNIVEDVALRQGKAVAGFSFEMSQEEQAERLTASVGGVDYGRLRSGQLDDEDWPRVVAAIKTLRKAPLRLSKPHTARVESVCAQARRMHAKEPLGAVVVDYLQLMDTKGSENRTQGVSEISRQLKMLAVDLGIVVIALSQLNRSLEARADKRPVMSDLRESGAIEQDADIIVFIYRDEVYNPGSPDTGTAELIFAKQRGGKTGTIRVASRLDVCRFDNLSHEWSRPDMPQQQRARSGFRRSGRDSAAGGE